MLRTLARSFFLVCFFFTHPIHGKPFVIGELMGQLGNQMFIIAATMSYAWDHNFDAYFPNLAKNIVDGYDISKNYKMVFYRLNSSKPSNRIMHQYREPYFHYAKIPRKMNVKLIGYFQSEKYFSHHKKEIVELFAPSLSISQYLGEKYSDITDHPNTVSVHVRSYLKEDSLQNFHPTLPVEYFEKAMDFFHEDSLFVVFSNDMEECKKAFAHLNKNIRFIEGEDYIYDFYLMSLCKDHIISNSSFSWWAAYLNQNPNKIVIAPSIWFGPSLSDYDTKDLLPQEWMILDY